MVGTQGSSSAFRGVFQQSRAENWAVVGGRGGAEGSVRQGPQHGPGAGRRRRSWSAGATSGWTRAAGVHAHLCGTAAGTLESTLTSAGLQPGPWSPRSPLRDCSRDPGVHAHVSGAAAPQRWSPVCALGCQMRKQEWAESALHACQLSLAWETGGVRWRDGLAGRVSEDAAARPLAFSWAPLAGHLPFSSR